jgi:hypothetical protein
LPANCRNPCATALESANILLLSAEFYFPEDNFSIVICILIKRWVPASLK